MLLGLAVALSSFPALAINASLRYRSPRNPERSVRSSTQLIVLHTTEAPARSSLNKLSDRGEAHFCVTEEGQVYAIVDRDREAFHAGRSMWNGKEDVDKFSIGIECVGYHNKAMPSVQIAAIRDLVKELKAMYRLTDERVVCHSHVAYGSPNRWQKCRHRGRKRCGMLFAMPSVRRALQLKFRPAYDPDTRARRLTVGDPYLEKVLYGRVDTMYATYGGGGARPAAGTPPAAAPAAAGGGSWLSRLLGRTTEAEKPKPAASPKPPGVAKLAPKTTKPVAKPASAAAARPVAKSVAKPAFRPTSVADLKAKGYVQKGTISKTTSASRLVGKAWNAADTYYTIRNKVIPGNQIDAAHIESGMCVWMKK